MTAVRLELNLASLISKGRLAYLRYQEAGNKKPALKFENIFIYLFVYLFVYLFIYLFIYYKVVLKVQKKNKNWTQKA